MIKILHFSPVRKDPEIVKLHLESLKVLNVKEIDFTYSFYDDNINIDSSKLLREFCHNNFNCKLWNFKVPIVDDMEDSRWYESSYKRITFVKDKIIEKFLKTDADYLFLTDSDLILHPETLKNLLGQNKEFISSIFWTHFKGLPTFFPNAWMSSENFFPTYEEFINLKNKEVFSVDYTGACTLLSREILEKGVRFERISQVNALGEDKHFCVRAGVYGYQPYLSTYYPSFHLYDKKLVEQGKKWIDEEFSYSYLDDWLNDDWRKKIYDYYQNKTSVITHIKKIIKILIGKKYLK